GPFPAGSAAERRAARRRVRPARAGAEPGVRRRGRGLALLRGAGHGGHVRRVVPPRADGLAAGARLRHLPADPRRARPAAAPARGPAAAGRAADQPGARHRRRAVRAARRRDARVFHRLPQPRRGDAADGVGRGVRVRHQARGLRRGAAGRGGALGVPEIHLRRHRHPRHRPRPGGDAADGRGPEAHLPHRLRGRRRAGGPRRLPAGGAARRASLRGPLLRADHLHDLRHGWLREHAGRLPRRLPHGPDRVHGRLLVEHGDVLRGRLPVLHPGHLPAAAGAVRAV
ncbi:MAG: High-affinity branched-chain amino acid transport system permease protein LivH, partial [uncultured Acetobacteraceae bacterium]